MTVEWTDLGPARLARGDCLAVLPRLEPESIDLFLADPPYSSGGLHQTSRRAAPSAKYQIAHLRDRYPDFDGDNRDQRSFGFWSALWMGSALRAAKPGGLMLTFTDWRQLPITTDALQAAGWIWRGIVVWDKTEGARPMLGRFRQQSEYVVWGSKGKLTTGGSPIPGVFRHRVVGRNKVHITEKPVGLLADLLAICPADGTVCDPFLGSGSTGIAAVESGRRFVGCEISRHWFGVAKDRIGAAAG